MTSDLSISAAARQCVELYYQVRASLEERGVETPLSVSPSDCSDELGRFRIWANNIGALRDSKSTASLDMRLQDASKIKSRIMDTIDDLMDSLNSVLEISSNQRPNRQMLSEDDEPISELDELFSSAKECVTSLMKISVAIRSATTRDRYLKAETSAVAPLPNEWDIAHVAQKFPKVNDTPWLKQRLGAAITKRRQFLLYCQDHHEQMQENPAERAPMVRASTKASTLLPERLEQLTFDVESQVSAATSYGIGDDEEETALRVPSLEYITETFPFECPLCLGMLDLTTEQAWRKHVFRDLRPYVCTFGECDVKLFESRHAWFNHELEQHRLQWSCRSCDHPAFVSKQRFLTHMEAHVPTANPDQLAQLAKASCQPVRAFEPTCPFCEGGVLRNVHKSVQQQNSSSVSMQELRRHLGRHMEQLALFALPKSLTSLEGGSSDESMAADIETPRKEYEDVGRPSKSARPTHTRVLVENIAFETLDAHQLPWIHDLEDDRALIVGKVLSDDEQRALVEHTQELRAARQKDPKALPPVPLDAVQVMHRYQRPDSKPATANARLHMKREYIEPTTLDTYEIPWEDDPHDRGSIIIKQGLNEREQMYLFEHTRILRRRRADTRANVVPGRMYLCKGHDCLGPTKVWHRLDEFQAHCKRRHPTEDPEDLIYRSIVDVDAKESDMESYAEGNLQNSSGEANTLKDSSGISSDEDEPTYCYCGGISYGEMIACDGPRCEREWFHLDCTGLSEAPQQKETWFCRDCQPETAKANMPGTETSSRQFSASDARQERGHQGTKHYSIAQHDDNVPTWREKSADKHTQRLTTALYEEERRAEESLLDSDRRGSSSGHDNAFKTRQVDPIQASNPPPDHISRAKKARDQAKHDRLYYCATHAKSFGTKHELDRHYRDTHSIERMGNLIPLFACPWNTCNKQFRRGENLQGHIDRKHGNHYPPEDASTNTAPSFPLAAHASISTQPFQEAGQEETTGDFSGQFRTDQAIKSVSKEQPIKFKDSLGRKFRFPFRLCQTWEGMEDLIRQAFLHVDVIGAQVAEGRYDLIGPNNEIILPGVWESVIEPGWTITMHMWPMPMEEEDGKK